MLLSATRTVLGMGSQGRDSGSAIYSKLPKFSLWTSALCDALRVPVETVCYRGRLLILLREQEAIAAGERRLISPLLWDALRRGAGTEGTYWAAFLPGGEALPSRPPPPPRGPAGGTGHPGEPPVPP